MSIFRHTCVRKTVPPGHPLYGKKIYVPAMAEGSAAAFCAVLRWMGIEAQPTPPSDERTLELGAKYTTGDECYPAKVTAGDFLKIIEQPGFDPGHTVFLMATGDGPCRFGQYAHLLKKLLKDLGFPEVDVMAPKSEHGYSEIGDFGTPFVRGAWRALVSSDLLRKKLLMTRPYERKPGTADRAFQDSVDDLCRTIEQGCSDYDCQMEALVDSLERARQRFGCVEVDDTQERPLIGVVGEIFCRLNTFSNSDLVRRLEKQGAECWISDIAEWIGYTNAEEARKLRLEGHGFSTEMLKVWLRSHIQHQDEHRLLEVFAGDFEGYEEPAYEEVMELARPYLPNTGVDGEMVMSVGKVGYLARKGADGVVDISPFTCMNGIVSEAVYPRLSQDLGGFPIRNFYFDGTQSDLDRDVGIYLELARSYREKKTHRRDGLRRARRTVAPPEARLQDALAEKQ
jgi:predicted nucleotide-binding protein (sugar kinase/HSP70/actin superfamily)